MSNWDIYIGIAIAIVVIVIVCYLLSKVCKVMFAILSILFKPVIWFFGLFSSGNKKGKSDAVASAAPKYKSLAEFAATVASDPKAIDSNLHAIFSDLRDDIASVHDDSEDPRERAILAVPLASLDLIANAKIADKSKPMFTSVGELAFAVEDKVVRLDAAIRRILTEIYDYCEVCSDNEDMTSIAYDLELALWPHEQSQAQAEAASKRQAKIEARIDAQLKAQNVSTRE